MSKQTTLPAKFTLELETDNPCKVDVSELVAWMYEHGTSHPLNVTLHTEAVPNVYKWFNYKLGNKTHNPIAEIINAVYEFTWFLKNAGITLEQFVGHDPIPMHFRFSSKEQGKILFDIC